MCTHGVLYSILEIVYINCLYSCGVVFVPLREYFVLLSQQIVCGIWDCGKRGMFLQYFVSDITMISSLYVDKHCEVTSTASPSQAPPQRPHPQAAIDVKAGGVATSHGKMMGGNVERVTSEEVDESGRRDDNETSLSEKHIESIMVRLKGGHSTYECPICLRQLHSHETEFSARLHIEQCLLTQERGK